MFLNTPTVKKLFKRAFNTTGLVVGRPDEELIYIAGSGWQIEMDYEKMPFKQKAQLIELIGNIPEVGQVLEANKDEQQFKFITDISLRKRYMLAKVPVHTSPVVIARSYIDYQLLQEQERNTFLAVNREFISAIDIREIDFENEGMPSGPCMCSNGSELFWHNAAGTFCINVEKMDGETLSIVELLGNLRVRREI